MVQKVYTLGMFLCIKKPKKLSGTGFMSDLKYRFKLTATTEEHNIITKPCTFGSCVTIMEKGCVGLVVDLLTQGVFLIKEIRKKWSKNGIF